MDPNSTYQIFLSPILNATLNQQPQEWYQQFLAPSIGFALGALLSAVLNGVLEYKRKVKENRILVYSRLKGERVILFQMYGVLSDYSIRINSHRHKILINEGKYNDDVKNSESTIERLSIKFDDMIIKLADVRVKWWEDVGLAQILFPRLVFKYVPNSDSTNNIKLSDINYIDFQSQANIIQNSESSIIDFMNSLDPDLKKERDSEKEPTNLEELKIWRINKKKKFNDLLSELNKNTTTLLETIDHDLRTK